jgi:hypothetical protein
VGECRRGRCPVWVVIYLSSIYTKAHTSTKVYDNWVYSLAKEVLVAGFLKHLLENISSSARCYIMVWGCTQACGTAFITLYCRMYIQCRRYEAYCCMTQWADIPSSDGPFRSRIMVIKF